MNEEELRYRFECECNGEIPMGQKYRVVYRAWPYVKATIADGLTFDEAKEVLGSQPAPMISADRDEQPRYRIEPDN